MNEEEAMKVLLDDYRTMISHCIDNKLPVETVLHYVIYTSVGLSLKYIPNKTRDILETSIQLAIEADNAIKERNL